MLRNIKIKISNFIHNNFKSQYINIKNKRVFESYKKVYEYSSYKRNRYKRILLDGGFYNLGYFYRLQLVRAALKSINQIEKAFIWDCNFKLCHHLLKSIGINNVASLNDYLEKDNFKKAENFAKNIKTKEDIINLKLPYKFPGYIIYDIILRFQRNASVDIKDKNLKRYIYKVLNSINFANKLINDFKPQLIVLSHSTSIPCAALAWLASQNKIPVLVLTGDHGIPRIWKISKPKDIFLGVGHPMNKNIKSLTVSQKTKLMKVGEKYIEERVSGKTTDLGGKYAFQKKKKALEDLREICKNKKVIAIYSNTFFDFPHTFGMSRFLDVLDWILNTINKASYFKNIIWLVRPHPLDEWYGGIKLKDVLPKNLPENIFLLSYEYSGNDIINIADGLVTHHGTAGIEFSVMGKPVLVADKGWFHDFGFVKFPKSREDYLDNLSFEWIKKNNPRDAKDRSMLFAGIFYGIPKWQKVSVLPDDSDTKKVRKVLPELIVNHKNIILKEVSLIKRWIDSNNFDYHSYKIVNNNIYSTISRN